MSRVPKINKTYAKTTLYEIDDIMNSLGLEYFLVQGTCLGAYRDGDFIESDCDIDLGIKHEVIVPNIDKIVEVLERNEYKIKVESEPYGYDRFLHASRCGRTRVDIVDFALNNDDRFCANGRRNYCIVHKKSMFDNLSDIDFMGRKFKIPSDVEGYLRAEYGDTWNVPDPTMTTSKTRIYGYWKKNRIEERWSNTSLMCI